MQKIPERCKFTFDDFCVLMHDDRKGDLLEGVLYLSPPDRPAANRLFVWLLGLVCGFVEETDLGRIFSLKYTFRLDRFNVTQPDLAFVSRHRCRILRRDFAAGAPDLVMEVVAPDSIERDYKVKRKQYERARVREYWIIDEVFERISLLRLNDRGKYRFAAASDGILRSRVLPGFWLRPERLWREPRPDVIKLLKEMLGKRLILQA